jgi:zinc D-Ala-D-Ala dipeptidase
VTPLSAFEPRRSPPADLVDLRRAVSGILVDLRYATSDNFLGRAVYPRAVPLLRRSAAGRLARAETYLRARGYRLVIWDAYRPLSVQRAMWRLVPDRRYVAPPSRGSKHNRGAAVDVTLALRDGTRVEMPTRFDDFSHRARRGWSGATAAARKHSELLETAMRHAGFQPYAGEWWHFDAPDWRRYGVLDVPLR